MNKSLSLGGALALVVHLSLASAPAHAGDGKDTLKLMPRDTALVLSIDAGGLRKSKLAKQTFSTLTQGSDVADAKGKLIKGAGVDIDKDIDTVVVSIAGDLEKSERIVLFVEGRFDEAKLVKFFKAESKSFARKKHDGITYYAIDDDNEFAFLGKYFVATPKGGITDVLDRHQGKGSSASQNGELKKLLKTGHSKKQVFLAMVLTASMRKEIAAETGGHSMDTAIVGMDMAKNLDVSMRLGASDATAASALATKLRATVAEMAKEPSMSLVGLADTFKNMTIQSSGNDVDCSLSVSASSVQQMLGIIQSLL